MKKHKLLIIAICICILSVALTVTLFATGKTEAERICDRICETPPTVSQDGTQIILPDSGNSDYRVVLFGTSNEAVIDKNGKITQPLVDKEVSLVYKVEKISDTTEVALNLQKEAKIMVRGKNGTDGINAEPKVLPRLQEWYGLEGTVALTQNSRIICTEDAMTQIAKTANEYFKNILGYSLTVVKAQKDIATSGDIVLQYQDRGDLGQEGYLIDISDIVTVTANRNQTKGLIFGNVTLAQILSNNENGTLPKGQIRDYPSYRVRSLMIDVGRYYIPLEYLREVSKYMAYYKMSEVRIHINDTGGENYSAFRLESEKYPLLNRDLGDKIYKKADYRQYQKDMLNYGLTVVTEIDTPAHASCFRDYAKMLDWVHFDLTEGENYNHNLNLMSDLLSEYMDGPDPVFVNKDFHIGMDEYPADKHDRFLVYMGDLARIVKEKGYNPRVWGASLKDDFAQDGIIKIDKDVPINLWSTAQASYSDFVQAGYPCINNHGGFLYVVPGKFSKWFAGRLDLESLYSRFEVSYLDNLKYSSATPNILGAEASLWNDVSCGMTPFDLFDLMKGQIVLISEKTWFGTNQPDSNYADFAQRVNTLGAKSPISNPGRFITNEEKVASYNFESDAKDSTGKFDGQLNNIRVENGKAVFDGKGYLSLPMNSVGIPYTVSFDINISSATKENAILFDGKDGTMYLNYNGTNKLAYKVHDNILIFDYELKKDVEYKITLACDKTELKLYLNGMYVGVAKHTNPSIKPENVRATTFVIPTERIGGGLVGTIDNLEISSKCIDHGKFTGNDILSYGNLSRGAKVEYSGNEPGINCTPSMVTDGEIERNGKNKVSLNRKDDAYIQIDLGRICKIDEIKIYWINTPYKYEILVSTDGNEWESVTFVTQPEKGKTYYDEVITLDKLTDVRFVKMQQVKQFLNFGGNGEKRYYSGSLSEIEVYGVKEINNAVVTEAENLVKSTVITAENRAFMENFKNSLKLVKLLRDNADVDKYGPACKLLSAEIDKIKRNDFSTNGLSNEVSAIIAGAYVTDKLYQKNEFFYDFAVESRIALYGVISTDCNVDYAKATNNNLNVLFNGLERIPVNKTELETLIKDVRLPFEYTKESYVEYGKVYKRAKEVFLNENADKISVDEATGQLKLALSKLQKKQFKIENSALLKPTKVSSIEDDHPSFKPEYITDGKTNNRFSLGRESDNQWFYVDLGRLYSLDSVEVLWSHQSLSFEIQISNDAINWTTVKTVAKGANPGGYSDYFTKLDPCSARYVRVLQTARFTAKNGYKYSGAVYEFKVNTKNITEAEINVESEFSRKYLPIEYKYGSYSNLLNVKDSVLERLLSANYTEADLSAMAEELVEARNLLVKAGKQNIAQDREVESSGNEASTLHEGYLLDGDSTKSSTKRFSLNRINDAWFIVDLGRVCKLGGFELYCFNYPQDFRIEVSEDKVNWKTVYSESGNVLAGKYNILAVNFEEVVSARFVKFQQVEMFVNDKAVHYSASFNEMVIWGLDETAFKVNLQKRYDELKNTDTSKFHSDCKADFERALLEAKRVLDSLSATQEEVDNALANLKTHTEFKWTVDLTGHSFNCSCGRHIEELHSYECTVTEPTLSANGEKRCKCKICGHETVEVLPKKIAEFESVYLNLEEDVNIVYIIRLGEGITNPHMRFTLNGKTVKVSEYKTLPDGRLEFKFKSVTPECFGDIITAKVFAFENEKFVMTENSTVTVKDYCNKVCELHSQDKELVTLAKDILYYGAKSQIYKNYKTDNLVIEGERVYNGTQSIRNITGSDADGYKWTGAGLILNNDMDVFFSFTANDVTDLSVVLNMNGRESTYRVSDLTPRSDGKYEIIYSGVMACEFDSPINVKFVKGGTAVGETLTYSVNSYVSETIESSEDIKLIGIVKAIANYGESAKIYKNKIDLE